MTKILKCKIKDLLGVSEVEFEPNGESVTIGGANGQGKSATIKSMIMMVGGKAKIPADPVRHGAKVGYGFMELDRFMVELSVDPDRTARVKFISKDGVKYSQSLVNELFNSLALDPGEFKGMDRDKRLVTFRKLCKLDFTALDAEFKRTYEARTLVGYQVTETEEKLRGRQIIDAPAEEQSAVEIAAQIEAAIKSNGAITTRAQRVASARNSAVKEADDIMTLRNEAVELRRRADEINQQVVERTARCEDYIRKVEAEEAEVARLAPVDINPLKEQLAGLEEINRAVRNNAELRALNIRLSAAMADYEAKTVRLNQIDAEKEKQIAAAKLPVDGLGVDGTDVTFRGVPFAQLAESEQWDISTALSFALNPQGVVFMTQSGGLDKASRERVRQRAASLGVQLMLEVVDDADDVEIVIEGGKIKENRIPKTDGVPIHALGS